MYGRKILACAFPESNYSGLADMPIGSDLTLTFEKAIRSKRIYITKGKHGKDLSLEVASIGFVGTNPKSTPLPGVDYPKMKEAYEEE